MKHLCLMQNGESIKDMKMNKETERFYEKQRLAELCDSCDTHVPNGEGVYLDDERICLDCRLKQIKEDEDN